MNKLMAAALVAFSGLAGCGGGVPKEIVAANGVRIPWRTVCTYDNCGAGGTLVVHPSSETPVLISSAVSADPPPIAQYLGNKMDPSNPNGSPSVCKGYISLSQYAKTYESQTNVTTQMADQSSYASALKASFGSTLGSATTAQLKAELDADIEKAVSETLNGKFVVSARAYTLDPGAFDDRIGPKACNGQSKNGAVVYSISVITLSGTAQQTIETSLASKIKVSAALAAAIASGSADADAEIAKKTHIAADTAAQGVSIVVSLGFDINHKPA